jgi:predicted nucleic acid-binding protein
MAGYYFDTSALAKRYVPELGSGLVRTLCQTEEITISSLTVAELASGLSRRVREGALKASDRDAIYRQFLADTGNYVVLGLTRPVVNAAANLLLAGTPAAPLRTLDALHLATAQSSFDRARRRGIHSGHFVTSDQHLMQAASSIGLRVINPESSP